MKGKEEKIKHGICLLCSQNKKLSFEHVPPQTAFNQKPIFVQKAEHLTEQSSPLFGKRMRSNRGFGGYTLCESCNNNTGDWYARDFGSFVQQGMEILLNAEPHLYVITGMYTIKPLNVLKQILTMFMSADHSKHLSSQKELVDFILDKEKVRMPRQYKVYIYSNHSNKKRMMGYQIVFKPTLGVQKWSEINFEPFGYLLAEDSGPAHKDMCDISSFGDFAYNQEVNFKMSTAYLQVDSPWIGEYK